MLEKSMITQPGSAWLKCGEKFGKRARGIRIHAAASAPEREGLSFYAPDFAGKSVKPWWIGEELGETEFPAVQPLSILKGYEPPLSEQFTHQHVEILQLLEIGRFQKVVPVVFERLQFQESLKLGMFWSRLLSIAQNQFAYGFENHLEGMCGLTPEVLFSVQNGILSTMALAGTGAVNGPSLLDNKKELLEHKLVIENISRDLEVIGRLQIGETTEKIYGQLKHLHTPIDLMLDRSASFTELVDLLHPTAALGGWPRERAAQWLSRQSYHLSRGRFGAPFGFVSGEEMLCVVSIRGLQWNGVHAFLGAGCGVVHGSQAEHEWRELELKRESVRQILGIEVS